MGHALREPGRGGATQPVATQKPSVEQAAARFNSFHHFRKVVSIERRNGALRLGAMTATAMPRRGRRVPRPGHRNANRHGGHAGRRARAANDLRRGPRAVALGDRGATGSAARSGKGAGCGRSPRRPPTNAIDALSRKRGWRNVSLPCRDRKRPVRQGVGRGMGCADLHGGGSRCHVRCTLVRERRGPDCCFGSSESRFR